MEHQSGQRRSSGAPCGTAIAHEPDSASQQSLSLPPGYLQYYGLQRKTSQGRGLRGLPPGYLQHYGLQREARHAGPAPDTVPEDPREERGLAQHLSAASASLLQRTCSTCGGTIPAPAAGQQRTPDAPSPPSCPACAGAAAATGAPQPEGTQDGEGGQDGVPASVLRLSRAGGGSPIPDALRTGMESRFGRDFSQVRLHDNALAAEATQSVGAVAYTLGHDIAFASGAWQPNSASGLHLLAHELSHVVQQEGAPPSLATRLAIGAASDPLEQEADRVADAIMQGQPVSQMLSAGTGLPALRRAVSKVCNPPSEWLAMAAAINPAMVVSAVAAAAAFGLIAETVISANVVSSLGIAPGNFYLDNGLAGPIDPAYVAFIVGKNPALTPGQKIAIGMSMVARPDVIMDQAPLAEFEEIKPDSLPGRAAGRTKVAAIGAFFAGMGLSYAAGSSYAPMAPVVIFTGSIDGTPVTVTFEVTRDRNGLLVYDICVETDWLVLAAKAVLVAAVVALAIIAAGALGPVLVPAGALASNTPDGPGSSDPGGQPPAADGQPPTAVATAGTPDTGTDTA